MKWTCGEKGDFALYCGDILLFRGYAQAYHVDKRKIDIGDPIRETGVRTISVWLYSGVTTPMQLDVQPIKK